MKLNRHHKKEYFDNLNPFHYSKPFFGESENPHTEKGEIMIKSNKVIKKFNSFMTEIPII